MPQGSILGPLFFLFYINDLTNNLQSYFELFADDTSLFTVVQDPTVVANDMNHNLGLISYWVRTWKISFNPTHKNKPFNCFFQRKDMKLIIRQSLINDIPLKGKRTQTSCFYSGIKAILYGSHQICNLKGQKGQRFA